MSSEFNALYENTLQSIEQTVDVVDCLDLLANDHNLNNCIEFFKKYQEFEFKHNQRLLILNQDTDYYPSWDSVGNNIFNIITIIAEFDVSTDHIVILNANFGDRFVKEVNNLCDINNLNPIQVIDTSLWYNYPPSPIEDIDISINKKNLFCFLNGVSRSHRKTMYAWLAEYDLLEHGNISWHTGHRGQYIEMTDSISNKSEFNKNLRIVYPTFSRINEELGMSKLEKQLHIKHSLLYNKDVKHNSIKGAPNEKFRWRAPFLQESLIYLIAETVGDYPHVYISEKTWKACASKVPFMIAGAQHSLKILKDKGFQTFSNIWDESYDDIPDFYNRSNAIAEQLQWLKNQDYNKIINDCIPILEHNHNHLKQFYIDELSRLTSELKK